tara:strand:+ start:6049 stop:6231 length:183 start_codon:yes stop_codon:yes gene_type:complete
MYKVGDKVAVETKHYGKKVGVIIEAHPNKEWPQISEFLVRSDAHPRDILASLVDIQSVEA